MTNEKHKHYRQMRLIDDELMNVALKDNKPAVQHILRIILNIPDLEVTETAIQDIIQNRNEGHSVKLDVTARDSKNRIYDIEFQRLKSKASPKRARYYCSSIDTMQLDKAKDFDNLPEIYVIFVTEGDYFEENKAIYHVERTVRETGKLYEDAEHIIYVNALCREDSPLGELMHDLTTAEPKEIRSPVLAQAVSCVKNSEDRENMYYEDFRFWTDDQLNEMKAYERSKAHEAGRNEGRETANNAWIANLRNAGMSEAQIKALMPSAN